MFSNSKELRYIRSDFIKNDFSDNILKQQFAFLKKGHNSVNLSLKGLRRIDLTMSVILYLLYNSKISDQNKARHHSDIACLLIRIKHAITQTLLVL